MEIKNYMIAKNILKKFSQEKMKEIESQLYSHAQGADELRIECVDAYHFADNHSAISENYTWYIPANSRMTICDTDLLVVEQSFGNGLGFAIADGDSYFITQKEHEESMHPFCRVLSNLSREY